MSKTSGCLVLSYFFCSLSNIVVTKWKKNKMGGACSTHAGWDNCVQHFNV